MPSHQERVRRNYQPIDTSATLANDSMLTPTPGQPMHDSTDPALPPTQALPLKPESPEKRH